MPELTKARAVERSATLILAVLLLAVSLGAANTLFLNAGSSVEFNLDSVLAMNITNDQDVMIPNGDLFVDDGNIDVSGASISKAHFSQPPETGSIYYRVLENSYNVQAVPYIGAPGDASDVREATVNATFESENGNVSLLRPDSNPSAIRYTTGNPSWGGVKVIDEGTGEQVYDPTHRFSGAITVKNGLVKFTFSPEQVSAGGSGNAYVWDSETSSYDSIIGFRDWDPYNVRIIKISSEEVKLKAKLAERNGNLYNVFLTVERGKPYGRWTHIGESPGSAWHSLGSYRAAVFEDGTVWDSANNSDNSNTDKSPASDAPWIYAWDAGNDYLTFVAHTDTSMFSQVRAHNRNDIDEVRWNLNNGDKDDSMIWGMVPFNSTGQLFQDSSDTSFSMPSSVPSGTYKIYVKTGVQEDAFTFDRQLSHTLGTSESLTLNNNPIGSTDNVVLAPWRNGEDFVVDIYNTSVTETTLEQPIGRFARNDLDMNGYKVYDSSGTLTLGDGDVEIPNGNLDINGPSDTGGALDVGGAIYVDGDITANGVFNAGNKGGTSGYLSFKNLEISESNSVTYQMQGGPVAITGGWLNVTSGDVQIPNGNLDLSGATSSGKIATGNNQISGMSVGDINVSQVYHDGLTAKSPVVQCSQGSQWCEISIPENQTQFYVKKGENWDKNRPRETAEEVVEASAVELAERVDELETENQEQENQIQELTHAVCEVNPNATVCT